MAAAPSGRASFCAAREVARAHLGAALLAAILCLPISAPIMAALFGAATELFGPKP